MKALTAEEITALLKELDNFPGGPAEALRILGVKGLPSSGMQCIIRNYLNMHGQTGIVSHNITLTYQGYAGSMIDNPEQVSEFISEFDSGLHKDLIEWYRFQ